MHMENLHVAPKKRETPFYDTRRLHLCNIWTSGGKLKKKRKSISSHELTKQRHSRSSKQGNSRSFKRILFFCLLT